MFIENKYSKWYFSIVYRAMSRDLNELGYIEKHHIIPKSLGGNNVATNLVSLTAKEHFICHLLLPKMTSGDQKRKMVYAAWRMAVQKRPDQARYRVSSKVYEMIKTQRSAYLKTLVGPLNPNFGNKTGRTTEDFTPEWRAKLSASRKGKSSWNKGVPRTADEIAKISATRKQRALDPTWNIRPPCSAEKAQKIKEANMGKKWLHRKETNERKYVSPDDFILLCTQGWAPGFGPRS